MVARLPGSRVSASGIRTPWTFHDLETAVRLLAFFW